MSVDNYSRDTLGLECDIDIRLARLWQEVMSWPGPYTAEDIGYFIRDAYGQGYTDCLREPPDERGSLCREHGFAVPLPGER